MYGTFDWSERNETLPLSNTDQPYRYYSAGIKSTRLPTNVHHKTFHEGPPTTASTENIQDPCRQDDTNFPTPHHPNKIPILYDVSIQRTQKPTAAHTRHKTHTTQGCRQARKTKEITTNTRTTHNRDKQKTTPRRLTLRSFRPPEPARPRP